MTPADQPIVPDLFAIQLEEVYCASTRAERRDRRDDETDEGLKGSRINLSSTDLDDDRLRFRCRLEVSVVAPVLEQEVAELTVLVQGLFVADEPISDELHEAFTEFTPMVQLYPYARAYLGDLGRMLAVVLRTLPLITVSQSPEPIPVDADDEDT